MTQPSGTSKTQEQLSQLLLPEVEGLGLDLEEVNLSAAGKRRVLRVAVDKDGGVDMDDIAEATRAVSTVLDDSDVLGTQPYTLEVSSPGIDRPLTLPRHWRRNVGRLVKITPVEGEPWTGRVQNADDDAATLGVDGDQIRVAYPEIARAKVEIEFKAPAANTEPAGDDADDEKG